MASTSQPHATTHGVAHEGEEERATPPPEGATAASGGGGGQLVMPEDGYEWKKYGQKFIKNIQKIRSYFRCRDKGCAARKKVEWQPGDPSVRVVYEGAHQHRSSSSSSTAAGAGEDGNAAANRYELSAQYFGGTRAHSSSEH